VHWFLPRDGIINSYTIEVSLKCFPVKVMPLWLLIFTDIELVMLTIIRRGGEWSFKKSGSRKILAEFQGSRSLVFSADLRSRSLEFFLNVQISQISWSRHFKK